MNRYFSAVKRVAVTPSSGPHFPGGKLRPALHDVDRVGFAARRPAIALSSRCSGGAARRLRCARAL
jgi:hypothetical protein